MQRFGSIDSTKGSVLIRTRDLREKAIRRIRKFAITEEEIDDLIHVGDCINDADRDSGEPYATLKCMIEQLPEQKRHDLMRLMYLGRNLEYHGLNRETVDDFCAYADEQAGEDCSGGTDPEYLAGKMLLNPSDYKYEYYRQARGKEGASGALYLGVPKRTDLCAVLVKSDTSYHAINEFIGCYIGQQIGVNTPRAWLFRSDTQTVNANINFNHAVGMEFLDGLTDQRGGSFETEELTIQTIQCEMLHIFMAEMDHNSIGAHNGKLYAIDFADSLFVELLGTPVAEKFKQIEWDDGFTYYEEIMLRNEILSRRDIRKYMAEKIQNGISADLVWATYSDLRERMLKSYSEGRFEGLFQEVQEVFSERHARVVKDLLAAVYNTFLELPMKEGKYYKTKDGVILVANEEN